MKKLNKKFLILIVVVLIVGLFFIFKGKKSKNIKEDEDLYNEKFNISKTDAFFLKDPNGEGYALFNSNGKKLTDFKFKTNQASFKNHSMLVETLDDKKCVLNDSGKIVVDCGKFEKLTKKESLYVNEQDNKTTIINSKGKVVKTFDGYVNFDTYIDSDEFLLAYSNEKYYVIDFEGDVIFSFDAVKDADSPTVNYTNGIVSVFYNKKTYIGDLKKNKKIFEKEDDYHLCVSSTDQKGNVIVLSSCASWYQQVENKKYVVLNKGKETYNTSNDNACKSISYYQEGLRCYTDNGIYLIDEKGKKLNERDIRNIAFSSAKNYAAYSDGNVVFYKNNKEVAKVKGSLNDYGYVKNDKVVVKVDNGYMLYNMSGKPITDKVFKNINTNYGNYFYGKLDDNQFVFITEKNKLTDVYYNISGSVDKYFNIQVEEGVHNVLDTKTGKVVLPNSKELYQLHKKRDMIIAYNKVDNEAMLYNVENGKSIIKTKGDLNLFENYFTNRIDGTTEYYSYKTGKKFLERKDS